ncbi:MAG: peptidoglycan DL-endopeptidase CwlO [Blastococcus sp.]|nr:peptidoglycan DL-endopeptidase CwlO [Blastococcus sp.]
MTGSVGSYRPTGVRRAPGPVDALPSRRSMRDGRTSDPRTRRVEPDFNRPRPSAGSRSGRRVPPPRKRRAATRVIFSGIVMTFAAALVATLALPSYAFDPNHNAAGTVQAAGRETTAHGEQRLPQIASDVTTAKLTRDTFKATSTAELKRAQYAKAYSSYTGPKAADFIKNPAHPPFSLQGVYETALKYRGVPYVFGGADPSGFDCSGYVMFVYAQFGVGLAHSVHQQDAAGTPISQSQAQPGDIVIFNDHSHDGFYAGNGMILHAPYSGASVRLQPLWTSDVHFVRFGIG